tara:strand:+ start:2226 stop:3128 length:903 start_codon:yes stop_codon:yes gene_type:complete
MRSYSSDLKIRVVDWVLKFQRSVRAASMMFQIGKSTVWRWLNTNKRVEVEKKVNKNNVVRSIIKDLIENGWHSRIRDLRDVVIQNINRDLSVSTVYRIVKGLGYSCKQLRHKVENIRNSKEVLEEYKRDIRNIGYENILAFDEVGFQLEMSPRRGWDKKGRRCIVKKSKGGRKNYTGSFLINCNGIVKWEIKDCSMTSSGMLEYFEGFKGGGKVLVLDNLRAHHSEKFKEKLREIGLIGKWLPPYSPCLNPIEEVFSLLKRELRYIKVSNKQELLKELSRLVKIINRRGLLKYFKHSYDV